jgi:hypothetical protein
VTAGILETLCITGLDNLQSKDTSATRRKILENNRGYKRYKKMDKRRQNYLSCSNRMIEKMPKQLLQHKNSDIGTEGDLENHGIRIEFLPHVM